jgi:hypothetical protein
METKSLWQVNYKRVTVQMSNGLVYTGKVNVWDYPRFSDFLRTESQFITIVLEPDEPRKVILLNKTAIITIEPHE